MSKKLLIVGAGPKAAAIAAKAWALSSCGYEVPEIVILERQEIAANWTGDYGYTDGQQRLGTPPEKDVGFPYSVQVFGTQVSEFMVSHVSWQAYQIKQDYDAYGDWVDRGRRHPHHSEWAAYLKWVLESAPCRFIWGSLEGLDLEAELWTVEYKKSDGTTATEEANGLVITGPGPAKQLPHPPSPHERILDGITFWQNQDLIMSSLAEDDAPIVVIGSGETAASVVVQLVRLTEGRLIPILIVNGSGTIFSRGEGYYENRMFTDPNLWTDLSTDSRREIIKRADRGVISVEAHQVIGGATNVRHATSYVDTAEIRPDYEPNDPQGPNVERVYTIGQQGDLIEAQFVVVAIGFDAWWFAQYLPQAMRGFFVSSAIRATLETEIEPDLSVPKKYLSAKLHLPMVAGIARGPGFPNLSCLGHVSDRILEPYVT